MTDFVKQRWAGPLKVQVDWPDAPGIPFSRELLHREIQLIPHNKSVAFPYAPGIVFKHQHEELTSWLYHKLSLWWSQPTPYIPEAWRTAWLTLLPKP